MGESLQIPLSTSQSTNCRHFSEELTHAMHNPQACRTSLSSTGRLRLGKIFVVSLLQLLYPVLRDSRKMHRISAHILGMPDGYLVVKKNCSEHSP